MFRKLVISSLLVILAMTSLLNIPRSHAQGEEVLTRVDQAMAHLQAYLANPFPINRQTHNWFWSEKVWNDEALECPIPGVDYPDKLTRGYRIRIQIEEVEYDYRMKNDGTILILCIGGQPDASSLGIPAFPESVPTQVVATPLGTGTDWTWFHEVQSDTLILAHSTAVKIQMPRPKLTDEGVSADKAVQVAISRDSRYMLIKAPLTNGRVGLGIYSFASGSFVKTHQAEANEDIFLGYGSNSARIFNRENTEVAVGFSSTDLNAPAWRVIRFSLETGDPRSELKSTSPLLAGITLGTGVFFPSPMYFDEAEGGAIHFQLVLGFAGGSSTYTALAWYPVANKVTPSPYTQNPMDIDTTDDLALFTKRDPAQPALEANGPFESHNVIVGGLPTGFAPGETTLFLDTAKYLRSASWGQEGQAAIFASGDQNNVTTWRVLDTASNTLQDLPNTTNWAYGSAHGFWSATNDGTIRYHNSANFAGAPIRQGQGVPNLVWTLPVDSTLGISQIFTLQTTPVAGGACPGAPVSRVAVGSRARVTDTVDNLPLRMRNSPNGEFLKSINELTVFSIIAGPQCANQFTWWQIRLADGSTGWSAEGDLDTYFMEPAP